MNKQLIAYGISIVLLTSLVCGQSKLLIITHNFNRPDFISIQYRLFNKFLKDYFEYVVFNDAVDQTIAEQINDASNKLNICCVRIPQENRTGSIGVMDAKQGIFWASQRHAQAIRYSLETLGFKHDGIVMIIDSDMFLIKDFSVTEFLKDYDIAGLKQIRKDITYLWAGLMIFSMDRLPDKETMRFEGGAIDGLHIDTGGALHEYFKEHPPIKIRFFDQPYRHFVDKNLRSYGLENEVDGTKSAKFYFQCNFCKTKNINCSHEIRILHELGFNDFVINQIRTKRFPSDSEFILNDTFFHFAAISNYTGKLRTAYIKKINKFYEFLGSLEKQSTN